MSLRYDYLRIIDGNSNIIGTYCGNQTGKSVRVFGTVAVLIFHTDGSVQSRGFELSFSFFAISPGVLSTVHFLHCIDVFLPFYPENCHILCIKSHSQERASLKRVCSQVMLFLLSRGDLYITLFV